MTIQEMHYQFVLRANKVDSLFNKEFTPQERDIFLNEAIIAFVNRTYNGTNTKGLSFEETQEMVDEIKTLIVHSPIDQPWVAPQFSNGNMYYVDLDSLKYEYLHLIRVEADINSCTEIINVNMVQYDDLTYTLTNSLTKPNAQWKRVVGVLANDKLVLYADSTFKIESVAPSYIKYPAKVSLGGYEDINGVTSVLTDCDLPENTHNKIIDLAIMIAQGTLENQMGYQVAQNKVVINS